LSGFALAPAGQVSLSAVAVLATPVVAGGTGGATVPVNAPSVLNVTLPSECGDPLLSRSL